MTAGNWMLEFPIQRAMTAFDDETFVALIL